jgi:hypothetical protein
MWPFFAAIPEEVVALHPEETSAGSKIRVHLRASQPLSDRSIKWFPHLWLLSTRNLKLHMWKWRIVVPLTHTQDQWITDSQGLSHLSHLSHLWVSQYGPQIHCVLFLIHFGFPLVLLAHHYRAPLVERSHLVLWVDSSSPLHLCTFGKSAPAAFRCRSGLSSKHEPEGGWTTAAKGRWSRVHP